MEVLSINGRKIHDKIESLIALMLETDYEESSENSIRKDYEMLLSLFDNFVSDYLKSTGKTASCRSGCSRCCCHWADDVYSFEAKIIAEYLIENKADIASIIKSIEKDEAILNKLKEAVRQRTHDLERENIDPRDAELSAFYNMDRPCELLNNQNLCSIYSLRPIICRAFVNISKPEACEDEEAAEENSTMIIQLSENCENMLNSLHKKFGGSDSDLGLRSQLKKYLQ